MNVIVVPVSVPQMAVFPKSLLLMITATPLGSEPQPGGGTASVAFSMVAVIVSPACTFQWVLLCTVPVWKRLPMGWLSDPLPLLESVKVVWAVLPDSPPVAVSVKTIPMSSGNTVKSVFTKLPSASAVDARERGGSTWGYSVSVIETGSFAAQPAPVMITTLPGE
jgi:hypothetical protein